MPAESGWSLGGGIANLFPGTDDDLKQVYLNEGFNNSIRSYNKLFRPDSLGYGDASSQYADLYSANTPQAKANADFYTNIAKGIFSDPATATSTYEQLRSGNLASLGDVYKNVLDYGLAGQKAKLAAGGYGNTGPSAYDRILSSSMTASNIAPVLNTIYGNLGRDTASTYGADRNWDAYRLGQFAQDPLTGYLDSATAGRAINPYMTRVGMLNAGVSGLGGLLPLYQGNSAGFRVVPGLATRLNNSAQGFQNFANFSTSLGGSIAGMGGGMGGMGGAGAGATGEAAHSLQGANMQMAPAAQSYYPQQMPQVQQSGGYYNQLPPMMQYQQAPQQYMPSYNPNSPALGGYFPG